MNQELERDTHTNTASASGPADTSTTKQPTVEQSEAEPNTSHADTEQGGGSAAQGAVDHNVNMGVLCYLGPLVLVPYLTERENPFIKFHIKQGLVLLGFGIVSLILAAIFPFLLFINLLLWPLLFLFNLCILILAIIGIVNAVKGEQKALPVIGGLAKHISI